MPDTELRFEPQAFGTWWKVRSREGARVGEVTLSMRLSSGTARLFAPMPDTFFTPAELRQIADFIEERET